ncbi:hypothetical protein NQ315_012372 [Exocentrus adspersus]|uniref:Integrase catalytic domain-containing protein n=1 Tax=Exocentrus adspersus TaxID=1586481 RepID=A0AAV8VNT3_9CUCU|nr:hypothetical protein NQ315_012372 [Exocentrus adspersus]
MKHLKKFNKYATNVKEDIVNELHKPARINFKRRRTTEPLINKSAQEVANAMNKILQRSKKIPKNLQTDMGKEFYKTNFNKLMKKYKINHYSVYSTKKLRLWNAPLEL